MLKDDIERIIFNLPKGLSELETVRYVYLELGKLFNYDTHYAYNFNYTSRQNIFEKGKNPTFDSYDVICNSSAEILVYVLKRLNINAECFYNANISHAEAIIHSSNNKLYCCNFSGDFHFIQSNRKTKYFCNELFLEEFYKDKIKNHFGVEPSFIKKKELKRIDDKLGYTFHGLYMDDFIEALRKEFNKNSSPLEFENTQFPNLTNRKDKLLKYKFDFLINHANIINEVGTPVGFSETTRYYWNLFKNVFSEKDLKKIHRYECFFSEKLDKEDMVSCIAINFQDTILYYLYSQEQSKYIETPKEKIASLLKDGLVCSVCSNNIIGFDNSEKDEYVH